MLLFSFFYLSIFQGVIGVFLYGVSVYPDGFYINDFIIAITFCENEPTTNCA